MQNKLLHNLSLAILPLLYVLLTRLLFATCRVELVGRGYRDSCVARGPFIAAFWHYSTYYTIHQSQGMSMTAMVSPSRDGEYMSRVLQLLGYKTVRGSRRKGGLVALKEMESWIARGRNAGIVADGSQGPAMQAQAGAVLLAGRTGAPILPTAWAADRYWTFGSWDRSILPKPFARITFYFGEPLSVPADIRATDLRTHRLALQQRLNALYQQAWARFGKQRH